MTKSHEFVKTVKHVQGISHPVITLYTDQQITDLKRFCCKEGGSVLGLDKTYNIGEFYVTPTVYKDLSVLRRSILNHPICFGPTFVHTSSTTKAYSFFMHDIADIADNLSDIELSNLTVGSDEELAFKASIKRCFPGCTHVLCTRHLKQNANRYMEDQVGYALKDRHEVLTRIFATDGLLDARDVDTYSTKLERLKILITEKDENAGDKKFRPFFENKLIPLFVSHVLEPVKTGKVPPNWTNKNSESENHVLKSETNWKLKNIPKFVKILYDIVSGEQTERCRAIRDMENFKLSETFLHHLVDIDSWTNLAQDQKDKRELKFLMDKGRPNQNIIVSTDGSRTLQSHPSAGKNRIKSKENAQNIPGPQMRNAD